MSVRMCDACSEFAQLLISFDSRVTEDTPQYLPKYRNITQNDLEIVFNYVVTWPQRQCMCCYRDAKNFERFFLVLQSILYLSVCQLKLLKEELIEAAEEPPDKDKSNITETETEKNDKDCGDDEKEDDMPEEELEKSPKSCDHSKSSSSESEYGENWSMQQKEKLMHIIAKIFAISFPLYMACKHTGSSRIDDMTPQENAQVSAFCDLNDSEIPAYLLLNVSKFCKLGGVAMVTSIFEFGTPANLSLSLAHSMAAGMTNLKMWFNFQSTTQQFIPLRRQVIRYLCQLQDKDLRNPAVKAMADFMWSSSKDTIDAPLLFDVDGLTLAFKYFNCSTLTMRLAGVSQITQHINVHTELCAGEAATDSELGAQQLAEWLTNNNIVEHLFGPNLHVEVIKQSQYILKFLAVEGKITSEHMELIWGAAQLKHCGRQVHDLLPQLIRSLPPKPCVHLYSLMCALPPKEHTEQSLYLASTLMRNLWSRGTAPGTALATSPPLGEEALRQPPCKTHHNSSSEASISMDQTNSDEDPCEELSTSGEDTGPSPRKQSKHRDLTVEQEWLREGEEFAKKECVSIKSCQKRSKPRPGSSGSVSSGAEELMRPRKKKLYKKRQKAEKQRHFLTNQLKNAELVESEEESSGSDNAHCPLLCEPAESRRLMDLRILESLKRRGSVAGVLGLVDDDDVSPSRHLPDLDEDDSACEEELARLAAQAQCFSSYRPHSAARRAASPLPLCGVDDVCRPGNTLLWDIVQDGSIEQLGEGLAAEAEKALSSLICFNTDKHIRKKFVEGCLDNLANHRSVAVSLRLLPKLFQSFHQLRGMDLHQVEKDYDIASTFTVVMWAERERGMMRLFMEDLKHYMLVSRARPELPHYVHMTELTVRLHFLTSIFTPQGSPPHFRLTVEQVEELWQCLVVQGTSESADCLYSWLLSHSKSPEQHALGLDALRFLYIEKMPTLDPETISGLGLSLYQQLCNLARMALGNVDSHDHAHPHTKAMDHLWKIALRANNTDVSMGAIQYLNGYYMGQPLHQEDDFVSKCMFHLFSASERLISMNGIDEAGGSENAEDSNDSNNNGESDNIYENMTEDAALQCIQRALLLLKTHLDTFKRRFSYQIRVAALEDGSTPWEGGGSNTVRIILQPAGAGPRAILCLPPTDLVGHLRAHVHVWWERLLQEEDLNIEGPFRMITQGQELTMDYDDRSLYDMGFKDNQLVFISSGVGSRGNAWAEWASARARTPTAALLQPKYFHQLFRLMQALGRMREPGPNGEEIAHTKAQHLSRRVWDILQAVPLNPEFLDAFQNPNEKKIPEFLDPSSPQKLMYSLHIIDKLSSPANAAKEHDNREESHQAECWSERFIKRGGLRLLYDIMMSGSLQRNEDCEWRQDCLALLLQLLCRIGTTPTNDSGHSSKLHPELLSLLNIEETTERMISILCDSHTFKEPTSYKTGFWGRAQVVQHVMRLCLWWARGGGDAAALAWSLRRAAPRLLLDDADPAVRREAGSALYRLSDGGELAVLAPLLHVLLQHLPRAADMRPHMPQQEVTHHHVEEGKEPYGPACRDYFWLVCRLIDGLPDEFFKEGATTQDIETPDLNELCEQIRVSLENREIIESRVEPCVPDDGLYGQLTLLCHLLKHPLRFKTSEQGCKTLEMIYGFLFDVPNPENLNLPKCKSQKSRAAAYDLLLELVKEAPDNYMVLYHKLMIHHKPAGPHAYPWDYWPSEEVRSESGFVGFTNLGATCYMASCLQHLFMMPHARNAILRADPAESKHGPTLREMQRMFVFLSESERKAYNPRSFCKVYQMDHQPLNTGEQKDMAEFFIDLVSKLEEMTPELKTLVKTLFCGVLSNNVVSLDCPHVSRTLEEFYTVRCQVADMRNLHQSLDEVTVKDTLEGDNCYTCSQCSAKVRAEKRACFKKLPRILCFNTMRYTFNMLTMLKEKVNTHFSFPMKLDMSGYVEKHLMPAQYQEEKKKQREAKNEAKDEASPNAESEDIEDSDDENYEYELIGVTVHTGTADGGHYYSFIRDRYTDQADRWLLFNDAEVKNFDAGLLPTECFGGEMTSKTYDSTTDKFMDFSYEKTNSAYMLFYELSPPKAARANENARPEEAQSSTAEGSSPSSSVERRSSSDSGPAVYLPPDLQKWIWEDNMEFLHDKNVFQHSYFTFMAQMCSNVSQSILPMRPEITEIAARLATSFFIETFIHAKEKPTMVSWVELVTKQFNSSEAASEWFLAHITEDNWWLMQVLIKCSNQMVRQMFQRLCIHVMQRLRSSHCALYLSGEDETSIGESSCVTRFIKMLLSLMETGAKTNLKYLTEYFALLYEFHKMGEEEGKFLLKVNAISIMINFYLGHNTANAESPTEEASSSGCTESPGDKLRPGALDKMVALIAGLVERSRDARGHPHLDDNDARALLHAKGFPFLYQQTRDCLNLQQTRTLIYALSRWNESLAQKIINMIFQAIVKHAESCGSFFKLLTLLVEGGAGMSGLPCFMQLVLTRLWDVCDVCPHAALEWLALQVPRNKIAHTWALRTADRWVEPQLLAASAARVRAAAALLLVALVPSQHFRQGYARARTATPPAKLPDDVSHTLHQVYTMLLGKLKAARKYTDIAVHGTMKLTAYFGVMSYCVVSEVEKHMFTPYFPDLWELYHPGISEPSVAVHPNKQALLTFWHAVCVDCPENVQLIVSNPKICRHVAFNYILADHEDPEVAGYNRSMLPPYYALLRLCCRRSPQFARTLASHQNLHWAFRNVAPHAHLYPAAADELLRLARFLASRNHNLGSGSGSETNDNRESTAFRRTILSAYLHGLNGRSCWTTLISAFCALVENEEDRLYVIYNGGLQMTFEAVHTLHALYHEGAGAGGGAGGGGGAPVRQELAGALRWARVLTRTLRMRRDPKEARAALLACKDWPECARRLLTLLTPHARPAHLRDLALGVLRELVLVGGGAALAALVPLLTHAHHTHHTHHTHHAVRPAPRRHQPASRDLPYHRLIDTCCRVGRAQRCMSEQLVMLSCLCALEGAPLKINYFAAFWTEVASTPSDSKLEDMLLECSVLVEYMDALLLEERESLEDPVIYQFMLHYFPKTSGGIARAGRVELSEEVVSSWSCAPLSTMLGGVRALTLLRGDARRDPHVLRAARAVLPRLLPADNDRVDGEEDVGASIRCQTPSGSEDSDDDGERAPRGRAYLLQLSAALQSLIEQVPDTGGTPPRDP